MDKGLAIVLNPAGAIRACLRNDYPNLKPEIGSLFVSLAADGHQRGCLDFFRYLHEKGSAFGWELELAGGEKLQLAGGRADEGFFVVGTPATDKSDSLFEELIRMQHDQTNRIRQMARDQARSSSAKEERRLLEELTKVNNEYATLQRKLVQQNRELEHLNEVKNRFVGMASHDLRNPLGVIRGYCEFLMDQIRAEDNESPQLRFLERIEKSANFMLGLVTDLLDISQIDSGKLELELAPTELESFVAEIVALNQSLADRKDITISLSATENNLNLTLDRHKIEQVLNNLIGNAAKYSPPGSHVQVTLLRRGEHIECAVQDQGPGIPETEKDKLFQPFGRTSVKATGGESSTGLGLAIAKRIVEGHGGAIGVTNIEPRGARFYFTLPSAGI